MLNQKISLFNSATNKNEEIDTEDMNHSKFSQYIREEDEDNFDQLINEVFHTNHFYISP